MTVNNDGLLSVFCWTSRMAISLIRIFIRHITNEVIGIYLSYLTDWLAVSCVREGWSRTQ